MDVRERVVEEDQPTFDKRVVPEPVGADAVELCRALRSTGDLASSSDDIFVLMVSRWRRAVLSSRRTILLDGVDLSSPSRVLDVSPGAGAVTRFLLEQGHRVVAVCGTETERDLVEARCAGLSELEVRLGGLEVVDPGERFDLVVHLPVSVAAGAALDPRELCQVAAACLSPDGEFVWAFRNPVGIDAICGLTDGRGGSSVHRLDRIEAPTSCELDRTSAGRALEAAGFAGVRWGGCFPDEESTSAVIFDDLLTDVDEASVVDQLVGGSLVPRPGSQLLIDSRRVLQRLLAAGLGEAVAPGWVVRARRESSVSGLGATLAVLRGAERLRPWQNEVRIEAGPGGREVVRRRSWPAPVAPQQSWLSNVVVERSEFVAGSTIESLVLAAVADGDLDRVRQLLTGWYEWLAQQVRATQPALVTNPFCPSGSADVLPPEHLDVVLSNFILRDGELHFIDPEWRAEGGVSLRFVVIRALCRLAYGLVGSGVSLPWPAAASGDMIAESLGRLIGVPFDGVDIARWRVAEAELQAIVYSSDPARSIEALEVEGRTSRLNLAVTRRVPFSALAHEIEALHSQLAQAHRDRQVVQEAHDRMDEERSHLGVRVAQLEAELDATNHALGAHERLAAEIRADIDQIHQLRRANDELVHRVRSLENRLPLRAYRSAKRRLLGTPGGSRHQVARRLRGRLAPLIRRS